MVKWVKWVNHRSTNEGYIECKKQTVYPFSYWWTVHLTYTSNPLCIHFVIKNVVSFTLQCRPIIVKQVVSSVVSNIKYGLWDEERLHVVTFVLSCLDQIYDSSLNLRSIPLSVVSLIFIHYIKWYKVTTLFYFSYSIRCSYFHPNLIFLKYMSPVPPRFYINKNSFFYIHFYTTYFINSYSIMSLSKLMTFLSWLKHSSMKFIFMWCLLGRFMKMY